ncbi:hypothetical protein [Streptomyces chattanoogensis]|uniref:hypothetical protein n=1 Tax=Streptomyces chattanoogensis TaxID=66876 RepID=UPI0005D9CDC0|nr:hypothetical protein T261_2886 [Streptomyces lydicus]
MPADPTEPDTFEDEANDMTEFDVEAPVNDAAQQHAEVSPQHDDSLVGADRGSANDADLAEQARVVELDDEDEYR